MHYWANYSPQLQLNSFSGLEPDRASHTAQLSTVQQHCAYSADSLLSLTRFFSTKIFHWRLIVIWHDRSVPLCISQVLLTGTLWLAPADTGTMTAAPLLPPQCIYRTCIYWLDNCTAEHHTKCVYCSHYFNSRPTLYTSLKISSGTSSTNYTKCIWIKKILCLGPWRRLHLWPDTYLIIEWNVGSRHGTLFNSYCSHCWTTPYSNYCTHCQILNTTQWLVGAVADKGH